jgi:hypothetical protein
MTEANKAAVPRVGVVVVHGVADAEQGHNLRTLVDTLEGHSDGRLKAEPYLEVYHVEERPMIPDDRGREISKEERERRKKPFFVQRGTLDARGITFAEVFWADTTRVEAGKGPALAAAFRIVFEMHYFINAFVPWKPAHYLARVLIVLLHAAALMIRGPVVGFNLVLITVGAFYISGRAIATLANNVNLKIMELSTAVMLASSAVLLGLVYVALKSAGVRYERETKDGPRRLKLTNKIDPIPLEVCVLAAVSAVIVIASLAVSDAKSVEDYGKLIFKLLTLAWRALSCTVIAAACVALVLMLKPPERIHYRSLGAAVGIVILQAALWALFVALPGMLLIGLFLMSGIPIDETASVKNDLAMNFVAMSALALAGWVVWTIRSRVAHEASQLDAGKPRAEQLESIAARMPRLIMAPVLLIAILVGGLYAAYKGAWGAGYGDWPGSSEWVSIGLAAITFAVTIGLYSILDGKAFANVVHIARDLIDHHYAPSIGLVPLIRPVVLAAPDNESNGGDGNGRRNKPQRAPHHPRRTLLQLRLESALRFLRAEGCEIVVFVAHSQGTVIVYEHFNERTHEMQYFEPRNTAVVTFGSPLQHLYAHYFHGYTKLREKLDHRRKQMVSWDNLYRIDDPIGARIDSNGNWVTNTAMKPGGHTNYWVEKSVAEAILRAIDQLTSSTPSARRP